MALPSNWTWRPRTWMTELRRIGLGERTLTPRAEISMPRARADLWDASISCQKRSNSEATGKRGSLRRFTRGTESQESSLFLVRAISTKIIPQKRTIPIRQAAMMENILNSFFKCSEKLSWRQQRSQALYELSPYV